MIDWIVEHLASIFFGLLSTGLLAYIKYLWGQKKKLEKYILDDQKEEFENRIETHVEPIKNEIEEIRKYIRENENMHNSQLQLIVSSYRFRLVQLCRTYLKRGSMTQEEYEHLVEFFRIYHGLGGNGQAEEYYNKTLKLEIKADEDEL